MNVFTRMYKEIDNYFYLKKIVKQQENSPEWKIFNLRRDWVYRVYTVVNFDQEFVDQVQGVEIMQAILEKIDPINVYLQRLNFGEILAPVVTHIEGTTSWLVVYHPLFKILTWKHLLITGAILGVSITGYDYRMEIETLLHSL